MVDPNSSEERDLLNSGFTMLSTGIVLLFIGTIFQFLQLLAGIIGILLCMVGLSNIRKVVNKMLDATESGVKRKVQSTVQQTAPKPVAQIKTPEPEEEHVSAGLFGARDIAEMETEPPKESWTESIDWEEWIGQKLLQKAGIAIVLIGMAVFLKYSFDNNLIGELGRLALSVLASAILFGAGEKFHGKYREWSYAFTGGGLALLYFTVWAADVMYETQLIQSHGIMLSQTAAMGIYIGITVLGVLASIRYNSEVIAWFAILGGYITPHLIQNASDPTGFVIYLAILTSGILGLAWYKKWKNLNVAAFLFTQYHLFNLYILPGEVFSDSQQLTTSIGFFALFGVLPLIYQIRLKILSGVEDILLILANGLIAFVAIIDVLGGIDGVWISFVCFCFAALYLCYAALALRGEAKDTPLITTYLVGSVVLIALALYTELEKEWVAVGWSLFSVVLVQVAVKLKQKGPLTCAHLLLAGSLVFLMLNAPLEPSKEALWQPFTSMWSLQSYIVFAALIAWIRAAGKLQNSTLASEKQSHDLQTVMHLITAALVFMYVLFESTALDWAVDFTVTSAMLVYSVIGLVVYWFTRSKVWLFAALAAQVLIFVFVYILGAASPLVFDSSNTAAPIFHSWSILAAGLLALFCATYSVTRDFSDNPREQIQMRTSLIFVALAQVWLHVSLEIHNMWQAWHWTATFGSRIISAWWIFYSLSLLAVFIRSKRNGYLNAAIVTLIIPFFYNLTIIAGSSSRFYETILWSLLPLALSWIGCRIASTRLIKAGILFLGITVAIDMMTHFGYNADLLRTSWWAIMGLSTMILGFTEHQKMLRQASITIFAAAVCKLLIFDFATLPTPVRIGASISTGLLLIGASYLYQRFDKVLDSSRSS